MIFFSSERSDQWHRICKQTGKESIHFFHNTYHNTIQGVGTLLSTILTQITPHIRPNLLILILYILLDHLPGILRELRSLVTEMKSYYRAEVITGSVLAMIKWNK